MARSVRISRRHALRLLDALSGNPFFDDTVSHGAAIDALRDALRPRPSKPLRKERLKQKARKKAAKKDETAAIRVAISARSNGYCECGCGFLLGVGCIPGEMDHFWGRGKARQTVQNCWLLSSACHRQKTNNTPSRLYWLERFAEHCGMLGYDAETTSALNAADTIRDIDSASRLTTTEGR